MKNTLLIKIGLAALAFLVLVGGQTSVSAQDSSKEEGNELNGRRGFARALEGTWNAQFTLRNCQTGNPLPVTFPVLNTFMRGGTMIHSSASVAPATRGIGHGVWEHEGGRIFTFALKFFRFNPDGTFAGTTIARREVEMNHDRNGYAADVVIESFNPAGVLVGTACAAETGTRFE